MFSYLGYYIYFKYLFLCILFRFINNLFVFFDDKLVELEIKIKLKIKN